MDPFVGEIKMVGFNFAPKGYALCNGALMSIAQNSALFALLGVTFGGDGVNTFGLPDYRGRGPVGMGQGPGLSAPIVQGQLAGLENVTLTQGNLPAHTHPATSGLAATPAAFTGVGDVRSQGGGILANPVADIFAAPGSADAALAPIPVNGTITIGPAGNSMPVAIRNPYLGTNFVIATQGVFPSRN